MEQPEPEAETSESQGPQLLLLRAKSSDVQKPGFALLKDSRVATAVVVAVVAGFGVGLVVSGRLWNLPPNYGDVPTWLAAGFAAIAGWVALGQLRILREQVADEARRSEKRDVLLDRQLEEAEARSIAARRGQAEGVKVSLSYSGPNVEFWIFNDSPRPITDIACQIVGRDAQRNLRDPEFAHLGTPLPTGYLGKTGIKRLPALPPGERRAFISKVGSVHKWFVCWFFTDDAGFRWQLDELQHLAPTIGDKYTLSARSLPASPPGTPGS